MTTFHKTLACPQCTSLRIELINLSMRETEAIEWEWEHFAWSGEPADMPCEHCEGEAIIKLVPPGTLSVD